ncbi:MAG: DUF58 domain-containing protein [Herbiconiux sp.]|nr:DUF58 domain-containing protein [Herbiconiux sp.]
MTPPRQRPFGSLPHLTVRGWGLLLASIAAFVLTQVLRRQELAYLACLLLAPPVIGFDWVALRRVSFTVRRRFTPESGSVGQEVTATLFVQNWGSFRSPAAVWSEQVAPPLRAPRAADLPAFPAFAESLVDAPVPQLLTYPVDTRHRGVHSLGPFRVRLGDPFGCAERRLRFGGSDTLLITPTVYELARIDLRLASGDGAEQVSRRLIGAGEQDVIARKYLPGDSMRRVHWPATAKHGELMVRQDDQRNDQDAVVLLDARSFDDQGVFKGPADAHGTAGSEVDVAFEWAVSAVASVAVHLMNEGYGVRLVGHVPHDASAEAEVFTAPFGAPKALRDLAHATQGALGEAGEFRAAVEEAALTSPDAPPVFAVVSGAPGGAARIRELAAMSSHPIAFVVTPVARASSGTGSPGRTGRTRASKTAPGAGGSVALELATAGWTVLECRTDDSLPGLWKALGEARGVS